MADTSDYVATLHVVAPGTGRAMNVAILSSPHCYRLRHHIESRLKQPGPGKYDVCVLCSIGYALAFEHYEGDEAMADRFVNMLRSDTEPVA